MKKQEAPKEPFFEEAARIAFDLIEHEIDLGFKSFVKGTLQWFVDFANMDLDTIKLGDKAKLLVESEEYLSPLKEISGKPLLSKKALGIAWPFEIPDKESAEYWALLLHLQKVVREHLQSFLPSGTLIIAHHYERMDVKVTCGPKQPFRITFFPITETQDGYIRFKILRLLEGFPCHAIRKCPGCEKFFFNPTRREKTFCSPKCMWKVIAGKRRKELKEKHPQKYKAYLKKQREIMSRKYEEKRKAELGPNVKVRRRKEG